MPEHLNARLKKLRARLRKDGFDGMVITNDRDIRYLTNYPGHDCYCLITSRKLILATDFRYEEEIASCNDWATILMRKKSLAEEIGTCAKDMGLSKVALQAEYLTVVDRKAIAKAIGGRVVKDTVGILNKLRMIKDDVEIKTICKAITIQQDALTATLKMLKPGQTEREVCAMLEFEMKCRGAEGPSFPPIIAARTNGSKPHYSPSPRVKVAMNQPLLIDWGTLYNGYCSDMTRTYALGKMPKRIKEIYAIVLESQLAAIDAIRPGVTAREIDSVARAIIADAGFGDRFGHGLGHGIGLDVHEMPGVSFRSPKSMILQPGMIVTVEPGIYLPGIGGVRIEDDVLVTKRGKRVLSKYPKDLESMILT